jgi:hypothetical protein
MNSTIEKIEKIDIPENKIEKIKEDEKKTSSNNQLCLKMLDYFVF